MTLQEIKARLENKDSYVIRMRSNGDNSKQHIFHDEIKGDITVHENDQDIVLLKADGIPTYHFAHAIDDTLMHTSIVLRGEEWLGTLPVHLELFDLLGFKRLKYAHTTVLMEFDRHYHPILHVELMQLPCLSFSKLFRLKAHNYVS